jgi:hypothetical protein
MKDEQRKAGRTVDSREEQRESREMRTSSKKREQASAKVIKKQP